MMRSCILILIALVSYGQCFNAGSYTNSSVLSSDPGYTVYWRVDLGAGNIYLALQAATTGFVAFGIGDPKSGSMPGADIVVGYYKNGQGAVEDRYATQFDTPPLDDDACSDWKLVQASESDGITTIELSRKLSVTDDIQDRSIVKGSNNVIWSFGTSDEFGYHGNNRGFTSLEFFPDEDAFVEDRSNSDYIDVTMSSAAILPQVTTYIQEAFRLPYQEQGPAHIIEISPIIDPNTAPYVHHFFVYSCRNVSGGAVEKFYKNPTVGLGAAACDSQIFAWGVGGNSLQFPLAAGIPMNDSDNAVRFIVLQVHYNNPELKTDLVDRSGIRIRWTRTLRQYDAGMLLIGDPSVKFTGIPPRNPAFEMEFSCPSECTQTWDHDIVVFGDFLHMHQIGKMMWNTLWDSSNQSIGHPNRAEYFAFDKQQITPVNYTINRGNRLNVHCIFDSSKRDTLTVMGEGSDTEMCINVLFYYPVLRLPTSPGGQFQACGYIPGNQSTICGRTKMSLPQPYLADEKGGEVQVYGQHLDAKPACPGETSTTGTKDNDKSEAAPSFVSALFSFLFVVAVCMVNIF